MLNLGNNPILGIIVYFILIISCLIQITNELGMHEIDYLKSHHGLLIFALGGLLDSYSDFLDHLQNFKKKKS